MLSIIRRKRVSIRLKATGSTRHILHSLVKNESRQCSIKYRTWAGPYTPKMERRTLFALADGLCLPVAAFSCRGAYEFAPVRRRDDFRLRYSRTGAGSVVWCWGNYAGYTRAPPL